jgi:hypothetical protein
MRRNAPSLFTHLAATLFAVGIIAAPLSSAQTKPKPRESKTSDTTKNADTLDAFEQQLRARSLDALRATGEEARQWKDAAAAARTQSQIADLTWDVEPDAARVQLVRAWESAGRVEGKDDSSGARFRNVSPRTTVRQQVLLIARRRDRALAEKWLEEMAAEIDASKGQQPRGVFDDRTPRSTVLLEMALANASTNPEAAAELATESLRDGVSFGFQNVLIAIQEKDFKLAATVFRAALARVKTSGLVDPNEVFVLASYLYTPGRIVGANTTENRGSFPLAVSANAPTIKAAAQLDPTLATEFLQVAADALVALPLPTATANAPEAARSQLSAIGLVVSRLPPQMSERATALRQRAQQLETDAQFSNVPRTETPDRPSPRAGESLKDYEARRIDSMEEAASKETDPLARDIAYAKAALATNEERYERGYSIAQNIKDEQLRRGISDWLTYAATLAAIKSNDLDRAALLVKRNSEPVERAASYVIGARKLLAAKDAVRAGEWLTEASASIKSAEPDEDAARAAFGVAVAYAQFDRLIALQTLASAVKIANQSPPSDDFEDERAPLIKRFAGLAVQTPTSGTSGFGLKAAAAAFGAEQFDDALATLRGLASPEARGVAVVALCREVLRRPRVAPQKIS